MFLTAMADLRGTPVDRRRSWTRPAHGSHPKALPKIFGGVMRREED